MSAYICDRYHISALAAFATRRPHSYCYHNGSHTELTSAEDVADILYQQNLRSVNERYYEQTEAAFTFDEAARYATHTPVQIIKAANCYDYQACETEDYPTTFAKAIIDHIISQAIRMLPGYEAAEWGLTRPTTKQISLLSLVK